MHDQSLSFLRKTHLDFLGKNILFALCFIGKAGYSIYENSKVTSSLDASNLNQGPSIVLNANDDILSIEATYSSPIESVSYQWYRGNVTVDEIVELNKKINIQTIYLLKGDN